MQSQLENDRLSLRTNLITTDRPDSSQLVDLHVYIIPKNVWKDRQNLAENEAMEQAVSGGFVRVPQNLTIQDLRQHILNICGQDDEFPKEFIYLRSVGRCLTKVKPKQETELRVKNYRPPMTFAPEIYVLEGHYEDESSNTNTTNSRNYLVRESPINQSLITPPQMTTSRQQSWIKPVATPTPLLPTYPSFAHAGERQNSTNFTGHGNTSFSNLSTGSSTLSARELSKLREEQERLRLRQMELAKQRREMEQEQQRRQKEQHEKQKNLSHEQQEKEEAAAIRIQTSYRDYRNRRKIQEERYRRQISNFVKYRGLWSPEPEEEQIRLSTKHRNKYRTWRNEHQWSASSSMKDEDISTNKSDINQSPGFSPFRLAATEIERLQKEARDLTRRKAEKEHAEEIEAHDVSKFSDRLNGLKTKRIELEATREAIVRRMQQLHAQISVRRKEERDLWKQKYLIEKKKTTALEERTKLISNEQSDINSQLEQTKIHLNNTIKLREQAENECRILIQELQQIRLSKNTLEKQSLPKQPPPPPPQQQQPTIPINLDITLQY